MSQSPCEHIEAIIQQITQDLQAIDDQLHALEVEGMNLMNPWTYLVLQRQVDGLAEKKRDVTQAAGELNSVSDKAKIASLTRRKTRS